MGFSDPRYNFPWSKGASTAMEKRQISNRRQSPAKTPATTIANQPTPEGQVQPDANAINTEIYEPKGTDETSATPFVPRRRYKSSTLRQEVVKPWLNDSCWHRPRRINNAIVIIGFILSLVAAGYQIFEGYRSSLPAGKYCLIMDDRFDGGLHRDYWSYETQTGGFEHGEFSWATADKQNIFVDDEGLHIVPTLTTESTDITESQLLNGYSVNLTVAHNDWGSCTSSDLEMCAIRSNATLGQIIPPVRSARITTRGKKSIKYGRVEVVAKMPKGDWLWPAIWMMPENSIYGEWPRSGEIDIAELRGNDRHYPRGRNLVTSSLHFGPDPQHDGYLEMYDTFFFHKQRTDFSDKFFTYSFEWYKDYMRMYVDHKPVLYVNFKGGRTFWDRGGFQGKASLNGTMADNPWRRAESVMAPFDQEFHLNLKVAVGAQHGYFYDNMFNKPWVDGTPLAAREFWNAREQWLPTWGSGVDRGMTVRSVKMWQQCE